MRLVLVICLLFGAGLVDTGSGSNAVKADMPCQSHEMMAGMDDDSAMDCCDQECATDCIAAQSSTNLGILSGAAFAAADGTSSNVELTSFTSYGNVSGPTGPPPKNLL